MTTDVVAPVSTPARSALLDNAKAMLIWLVVFGHVMEIALVAVQPTRALFQTILLFHMPAFAFVSGRLSKAEVSAKAFKSIGRLLVVYAVLVQLNEIWSVVIGHDVRPIHALYRPAYSTWFFLSLATWRLLIMVLGRGRSRWAALGAMGVSVVVAVASGYLIPDGPFMSLSRTCVFLPFFVAGYWVGQLKLTMPRTVLTRTAAVAAFAGIFAVLLVWTPIARNDILYARLTFAQMDGASLGVGLRRLALLGLSGALIAAFLQLVPRRTFFFTALGATTLSVYAWHPFILRLFRDLDLTMVLGGTLPLAILSSTVMVLGLGLGPIAAVTMRVFTGRPLPSTGRVS